jgi:hypothetical protein
VKFIVIIIVIIILAVVVINFVFTIIIIIIITTTVIGPSLLKQWQVNTHVCFTTNGFTVNKIVSFESAISAFIALACIRA